MHNGPSKKFLIRGGIATLIVVTLLVVQTNWFKALFTKKAPTKIAVNPNTTIGELVEKDTNGNGISDWEERLWGLDPAVLYTNGVSNKQIIEEKKRSLAGNDAPTETPSKIDKLAQDLYALSTALGETTAANTSALQNAAGSIAKTIPIETFDNTYTSDELKTTKTTEATLHTYQTTVTKALSKYTDTEAGMNIVIQALESGDYSGLSALGDTANVYAAAAKTLKGVTVPIGILQYHLNIMNGLAGMSKSFVYLENLDTDGLDALSGIALYKTYNELFTTATQNLNQYLQRYGIITS